MRWTRDKALQKPDGLGSQNGVDEADRYLTEHVFVWMIKSLLKLMVSFFISAPLSSQAYLLCFHFCQRSGTGRSLALLHPWWNYDLQVLDNLSGTCNLHNRIGELA